MDTIYILGYNDLGADFWSSHIEISEDTRMLFFKSGKSLLGHLKHTPSMIIVDEYFCENCPENHDFNDIKVGLGLLASHITTFFFSPSYTGRIHKSVRMNHFYSSFDPDMIDHINHQLKKVLKTVAA